MTARRKRLAAIAAAGDVVFARGTFATDPIRVAPGATIFGGESVTIGPGGLTIYRAADSLSVETSAPITFTIRGRTS